MTTGHRARWGSGCVLGAILAQAVAPCAAFGESGFGAGVSDADAASTAFAFTHLLLIIGMCLGVGVFALVMHRRSRSPNREQEFLEELREEELGGQREEIDRSKQGVNAPGETEELQEPWEKPADWWRE